LAPVEHVI
jgi:hypothetical protein